MPAALPLNVMCIGKVTTLILFSGCLLFGPRVSAAEDEQLAEVLANIATCFRHAVSVLNDQPLSGEGLGKFMRRAKDKMSQRHENASSCNLSSLKWSGTGEELISSNGEKIQLRIVDKWHDNFGERTSWVVTYEFFVPGKAASTRVTIELSMQ